MPDWKNSDDYLFTKNLSPEGWAWEFLRRNPEYQSDYDSAHSIQHAELEQFGRLPLSLTAESPHTVYYDPERQDDESLSQWVNRLSKNDQDPKRYLPLMWFAKKWGLKASIHPPLDNTPPEFAPIEVIPDLVNYYSINKYFGSDDTNHSAVTDNVLLGFDLNLPIQPQIEQAELILRQKARAIGVGKKKGSTHKNHIGKWSGYLRVLDAIHDGAKPKDIASVFDPHVKNDAGDNYQGSKQVTNIRIAAQKMMAYGYKNCLHIDK